MPTPTAQHWDASYRHGDSTRSWFQSQPRPSLDLLDALGVDATASVIDVGGGASPLVDALLDRGHTDVSVLDVSAEGVQVAQRRLGDRARQVEWIVADLLTWMPSRTWQVWHDRAVLHFFATEDARVSYLRALAAATAPGSVAVLATFAPDGPEQCSGLPVKRYDAPQLATLLGPGWQLSTDRRELHATPAGAVQPFTWTGFRRLA